MLRTGLHAPLALGREHFQCADCALLRQLGATIVNAEESLPQRSPIFEKHPHAQIITTLSGLGSPTGAQVLAGIGDHRSRFADIRSLHYESPSLNMAILHSGYRHDTDPLWSN